ncbi:MAG: DUF3570 domain-containing protein [Sandaracinaceae bacterium]
MLVAVPLAVLLAVFVPSGALADDGEASASIHVRGDTDRTVVVAPRVGTQARFNENRTTVTGAYSVDVWTSASVDIRTAASEVITEQRDQLDFSLNHELDDVTLGGSYYYSGENDYWSHGFTLRSTQELFGGSTTLDESVRFVHDVVGRAGDSLERSLNSGTVRTVLTQIFSPEAIGQLVWEGTYRNGFQSSPYRYVGITYTPVPDVNLRYVCGQVPIDDETASGDSTLCIPESHPSVRIRNAFVGRFRYAFSRDTSAGVAYRFYFDDWGVTSHTAAVQIGFVPARDQVLTLRYRFYSQEAASFYRSSYEFDRDAVVRYVTRDRELSPMLSNRIAIAYQGRAQLTDDVSLKVALAVGGTVFVYADFVGLSEVFSLDGTLAFTLEL